MLDEVFTEIGENPELPAAELPPEPSLDLAQARHMRRALEGAIEHGIALMHALDAAGVDLEDDGTAEPWLGWIDGKPQSSDGCYEDREHDAADWEPILGAPERHPACDPWTSGRNDTGRQTHWSAGRNGSANDGEAEAGYDLA